MMCQHWSGLEADSGIEVLGLGDAVFPVAVSPCPWGCWWHKWRAAISQLPLGP